MQKQKRNTKRQNYYQHSLCSILLVKPLNYKDRPNSTGKTHFTTFTLQRPVGQRFLSYDDAGPRLSPISVNMAAASSQVDMAAIIAKTHDTSTYFEASNKATSSTYMQLGILWTTVAFFEIRSQSQHSPHKVMMTPSGISPSCGHLQLLHKHVNA